MKLPLLPLALAVALAACSTPEQQEEAHQRKLEAQAKRNFERLKEQERDLAEQTRERAAEGAQQRTAEAVDTHARPDDDEARYQAYAREYARQLAKKPEQLTPEEREWVREHY